MRSNVLLALGCVLALAGCSLITDFQGYGSDGIDASGSDAGPRDSGPDAGDTLDAGGVDASTSDAGTRDGGGLDAGPRPECATLTASSAIGLGPIDDLPMPVTNAVYDVAFDPGGGLAVAWVTTTGNGRAGAWTVAAGAGTATPRVPVRDALLLVDTSGGAIHLGWTATSDWLVLGQRGLGYRAAFCGTSTCTSAVGTSSAQSPFAIAQQSGDFVLVHTLDASWVASTWDGVATPLERTPASLIPFDAVGTETGYVMLAEIDMLGDTQTAFVWFEHPPAVAYEVTRSPLDAVGALYVAYDASTDRAIGVVSEIGGGVRLLTASASDATPLDVAGWTGNPGPVVARGDGTFLVRASSSTYELRSVRSPENVLDTVSAPGDSSKPVIIEGEYAIVSIHGGEPRQLALRFYSCE